MPTRRRVYSPARSRKKSRQIHDATYGTHVVRAAQPASYHRTHAQNQVRGARLRKLGIALVVLALVAGIAFLIGSFVFRGVVSYSLTLKNSDAAEALVPSKSDEVHYTLLVAELGAVADPLDEEGPDLFLLLRIDPEQKSISVINIPRNLQIITGNQELSIASIAASQGDAALIRELSLFSKLDISHFIKFDSEQAVVDFIDSLGSINLSVSEKIDDPHAGSACIPTGNQTLKGNEVLTLLRAENIAEGSQGQLKNQLTVACATIASLFSKESSIATRLEALSNYLQTDLSVADIEKISSWLSGVEASAIGKTIFPGYFAISTDASGVNEDRYVSTSSDVDKLLAAFESGDLDSIQSVADDTSISPESISVSIQNGTTVDGAASAVAAKLRQAGFAVRGVGNAESPVYEETIAVFNSSVENGQARAQKVINELGVGRIADASAYYSFDSDVLLIIGADNKPIT